MTSTPTPAADAVTILRDCPFCGCAATYVKHSAGVQGTQGFDKWDAVACKNCRATIGACDRRFRSRDDAREAWNRRIAAIQAAGEQSSAPPEWVSEVCGPSVDDLSYGQGYRRGFNDCRAKVLSTAPAPQADTSGAAGEVVAAMKTARFVYNGMSEATQCLDYLQALLDNPLPDFGPAAAPSPVQAQPDMTAEEARAELLAMPLEDAVKLVRGTVQALPVAGVRKAQDLLPKLHSLFNRLRNPSNIRIKSEEDSRTVGDASELCRTIINAYAAPPVEAQPVASDEELYAESGYRHFMDLKMFKAFRKDCGATQPAPVSPAGVEASEFNIEVIQQDIERRLPHMWENAGIQWGDAVGGPNQHEIFAQHIMSEIRAALKSTKE